MKITHPFWRAGILAVVAGILLGLLTFFLIPVFSPEKKPEAVAPAAPAVLAAASATALPALDPAHGAPETTVLAQTLDPIFASATGATITASVIDVATGEEVYSRSGATPGTPASSLKVLTAVAATHAMGENTRFSTKTVLKDPTTVVLVGGGDVLLGAGENSASVSGRAGLGTLAKHTATALAAAQSSGQVGDSITIQLDESLFSGEAMNPAWDVSLLASHDIAPISPLAMYGARADAGAKTARVGDPGMYAAKTFASALGSALKAANGPTLSATVTRTESGTEGTELASVKSAPLSEQLQFMLEVSDNYVAETMGRLVAVAAKEPGDYAHGAAAVARVVGELGINTTGLVLLDTSGLAAADLVSPLTLASALAYAASSEHVSLRNISYWLPIAGATGTLTSRLGTPETRGVLRAKTGSLMEVSSLTGLSVTQDGRLVAFSFLVHTSDRAIAPHKGVLDAAALALTQCGCS
ncbi:MAG: D-alanyl-D-alanine carboxypeptidase/D-alanyl-D-alanine-endopeptidase [Paeniglutamicibacter terrestris]|uniref:D-alanyl-D-alanine carboxypeptidase/D-alanyl-D-alanine-endopeptidase n=1 Tax=Paeniglutamicibacter terrestris TaxID=2723403 RepID=A0ABX1G908_9MICC|nr:D-alanyl-D-alanine carboxypeptidase/D-alanyl-D-alanine-endopeptidase [Paeniglutamicibacter terrestris]NKG22750.1 D-alanyl-D-alanine carboxypeptidase/D-alanyl-D-alanine-endopeptidase [Paeniglutamicibacter terrestris]